MNCKVMDKTKIDIRNLHYVFEIARLTFGLLLKLCCSLATCLRLFGCSSLVPTI